MNFDNSSDFQKSILATLANFSESYGIIRATPSPAFWARWNESKNVVKAAGFTCSKQTAGFVVEGFARDLEQAATKDECLNRAKASAQVCAFWADERNWHLISNSKNT